MIELFVTPYDSWQGYDSRPEDILVSDLIAGETIGFAILVWEDDGDGGGYPPLTPEAVQTDDPWQDLLYLYRADVYLDGLLLPANPTDPQKDTAIQSITWGRIKASLDME